jgi:lysine-ketoglutarate reductase/saccharopine dehydrogenase-like protein (TIGR00300 family)
MFTEEIELEGHIIDSLVLTNLLDDINAFGGEFEILEIHVGKSRNERSHARIEVRAESAQQLGELLSQCVKRGAIVRSQADAKLLPVEMDGVFPDDFYATTNQRTLVRRGGDWHDVIDQEMDCGVQYDAAAGAFRCVPIVHVRRGDLIVVGHRGVKVIPFERQRDPDAFEFMSTSIATDKPKNALIRQAARQMMLCRSEGNKLLLVAGPAVIHTDSGKHIVTLIERGYVDVFFGGNAVAVHDVELDLFGTSLGVYVEKATLADTGHEHHLRGINVIRRVGGLRQAVEQGVLTGGVFHAMVTNDVQFLLAGSVQDDGPLPDTIRDVVAAQDQMRVMLRGVGLAIMLAAATHSVATIDFLPAWVPAICVDMNPTVLARLCDRGSFQTIGLVTDVESFLRELLEQLDILEAQQEEADE